MRPEFVFYGVCAVWVVAEIVLSRAKRSGDDTSRQDRGSITALWIAISLSCFLGGLATAVRAARMPPAIRVYAFYGGLALIVIGFVPRIVAIFTLRRYFTVDVAIAKDHKVINTGIYGFVRHPSYTGSLISFLGLGLAFMNWLSLAIVAVGPAIAFAYRIRVEERALVDALGDEYRGYAARTKRFMPGVF